MKDNKKITTETQESITDKSTDLKKSKGKGIKITKWAVLSVSFIILLLLVAALIVYVILYNKIYGEVPFANKNTSYELPAAPSGIVEVSGGEEVSYTEDPIIESNLTTPIYRKDPINEDILNILLIGRDVEASSGSNGRSDSMIVMSYNKKTGSIVLTSFLRDSLVPIEGHNWSRLNHTYSWGGVGLTINTINDVYKLDIQNYITIDYEGFTQMVNNMGGVTINISKKEANHMTYDLNIPAKEGENTFNGADALEFARIRHIDSDFGRTERQRRLITAVLQQVLAMDDTGKTIGLLTDGLNYIKTNLSSGNIISLAKDFLSKGDLNITTGAVPENGYYTGATYEGMSILKIDFDKNIEIFKNRIYGNN